MKYAIVVLLVALALLSSAVAQTPLAKNTITQSNTQDALAQSRGNIYEKAANWAVVIGDGNQLTQTNIQPYFENNSVDISANSTNVGLVLGHNNIASQFNDPGAIYVKQMNELIIIGSGSNASQSNMAGSSSSGNGSIMQRQDNFAVLFGNNTGLDQSNTAYALNNGNGSINQTEANVAYVYGDSTVNQYNTLDVNATENCTGYVNQVAKNLAFAISGNITPIYMAPSNITILQPSMSNSTQVPSTPTIPTLPSAPIFDFEFPMDP